ncbi:hypothetical protein J2Y70_004174 [Xanthomonas translucens]|nr:hypothetical protein [Xanthomonas translucens]
MAEATQSRSHKVDPSPLTRLRTRRATAQDAQPAGLALPSLRGPCSIGAD